MRLSLEYSYRSCYTCRSPHLSYRAIIPCLAGSALDIRLLSLCDRTVEANQAVPWRMA